MAYGPGSIYLNMNGYWNGGVYECYGNPSIDHAVVVVGWNDSRGTWILRNSWGAGWNGNGYFELRYGHCGSDNVATHFPLINPLAFANTNLITNGDFSQNFTSWWQYLQMDYAFYGSVLHFKRPVGVSDSSIGQDIPWRVTDGSGLELSFDVGNTSSVTKSFIVSLRSKATWDNVIQCQFSVPPQTPLRRYIMTGSSREWVGMIVEFRVNADGMPDAMLDNVSLMRKTALNNTPVNCGWAPAPANTNLALNPDFTGGSFANWKKNEGQGQTYTMTTSGGRNVVAFTSPTDQNYGAVPHQDLMHSLPANAPMEITFWAGNTSSVPKQIRANIVRVENTSERIECIFTIPANFPLAQYTIRGRTTNAWAGIRLHFWNNTPDNLPALIMTGTNVQYKPTLSVAGTSCLEPTFPTPAAPVLTAPTVTVTNNNRPTVASNSVANVSSYIFEFSLNNFSTIAHSATVTTTSYTPPSGLPDGTYSIRVRGLNALNQAGANSAPKTLTIDTVPPAVPVLSAPAANASITALTPTFSWIAPLGATGYELRYGFSNPPAQTISNLTTTSTTLTQPLTIGTVFWQVRAQDAADNWSAWSSVSSFNLDSAANTAPRVVRQGTSVTLTWNPQDWALGYEVQVATNSTFTAIVYQTNSLPAGTWQTTTTLPAGTYYWRMRIKSGATTWSPWSPVETLIVR
jgi:hypothetical protein